MCGPAILRSVSTGISKQHLNVRQAEVRRLTVADCLARISAPNLLQPCSSLLVADKLACLDLCKQRAEEKHREEAADDFRHAIRLAPSSSSDLGPSSSAGRACTSAQKSSVQTARWRSQRRACCAAPLAATGRGSCWSAEGTQGNAALGAHLCGSIAVLYQRLVC